MKHWSIKFTDGSMVCCDGESPNDAMAIAEHLSKKKVARGANPYTPADGAVEQLPYPAQPILWQYTHPVHGKTPDFCYSPQKCRGLGSCPQRRACTE